MFYAKEEWIQVNVYNAKQTHARGSHVIISKQNSKETERKSETKVISTLISNLSEPPFISVNAVKGGQQC